MNISIILMGVAVILLGLTVLILGRKVNALEQKLMAALVVLQAKTDFMHDNPLELVKGVIDRVDEKKRSGS